VDSKRRNCEQVCAKVSLDKNRKYMSNRLTNIFYTFKPIIPRVVQIFVRRRIARYKRRKFAHVWPIDPRSGRAPLGWPGWPDDRQFALILSHDVDTRKGYDCCLKVADLEEKFGFRSSFNFVPERYGNISLDLIDELKKRGFGIAVHGLKHDGKLFSSREIFESRAPKINAYMKEWGTEGFTAPSMIKNHEYMIELNAKYCISTFDTDPFEPQSEGVGTIFPFWISGKSIENGFWELPYTLPQDFTLFIILKENDIAIWENKLEWIVGQGGMALLNSHPDYMNFNNNACGSEEYPVKFYSDFLKCLKDNYSSKIWNAVPSEVATFCLGTNLKCG
jgi:hypothetical protein